MLSQKLNIENLSEKKILRTRLCDLEFDFGDSVVPKAKRQVLDELETAGFRFFQPKFYVGDEWFSPDGQMSVSIPFWLSHEKLRKIERGFLKYVEGTSLPACMRLLRHEIGHCFEHGYGLSHLPKWQKLFGNPELDYDPDHFAFDRNSKDFVKNIGGHYAQSHPEEDFAETFAVVLDPQSDWKNVYKNWPVALAKLEYTSWLIKRYKNVPPPRSSFKCSFVANRTTLTVEEVYQKRLYH